MVWISLGTFTPTLDWQFTELVNGEIFRIKHKPITEDFLSNPRAVIAQSFVDENEELNTFDKRIIVYQLEKDAFPFYFPRGISEHSLAVKRLDEIPVNWEFSIEVFQPGTLQQEIDASPYAALIDLLSSPTVTNNMKQALIPKSQFVELQRGFLAQPLVSANPNRAYLEIRAGDSPVYVWADDFDDDKNPVTILEEIDKGKTFVLPVVRDGIYKGAIFAQVAKKGNVGWTEYSYPGNSSET